MEIGEYCKVVPDLVAPRLILISTFTSAVFMVHNPLTPRESPASISHPRSNARTLTHTRTLKRSLDHPRTRHPHARANLETCDPNAYTATWPHLHMASLTHEVHKRGCASTASMKLCVVTSLYAFARAPDYVSTTRVHARVRSRVSAFPRVSAI